MELLIKRQEELKEAKEELTDMENELQDLYYIVGRKKENIQEQEGKVEELEEEIEARKKRLILTGELEEEPLHIGALWKFEGWKGIQLRLKL